jgi:hypothetical protein
MRSRNFAARRLEGATVDLAAFDTDSAERRDVVRTTHAVLAGAFGNLAAVCPCDQVPAEQPVIFRP